MTKYTTLGGLVNCTQCNALSKRTRQRCQEPAIKGKNKCRFHGGRSTGSRTPEGKARQIVANAVQCLSSGSSALDSCPTCFLVTVQQALHPRVYPDKAEWLHLTPIHTVVDEQLGVRAALRTLGYTNEQISPHGFRAMAGTIHDEVRNFRKLYLN
jgi:hypothetical protein